MRPYSICINCFINIPIKYETIAYLSVYVLYLKIEDQG